MIVNSKVLVIVRECLVKYGWSIWVGWGLGMLFNVGLSDIKFWIFILPLILLVEMSKRHHRKEVDKKIEKSS